MISKIIISLLIGLAGFTFLIKTREVVDFTGANFWVERVFGRGQSYTMYKILGIFIIFIAFFYLMGDLDGIFRFLINTIIPGGK
ncbi:hypothetical protein CO152_00660 [bacterium CG_4_9_14_3_um_filter_33_26]|nr:MAG: hypothetical protein CO152_00660 [bacterium CG_4_9_14_3_um_filter_33_26]